MANANKNFSSFTTTTDDSVCEHKPESPEQVREAMESFLRTWQGDYEDYDYYMSQFDRELEWAIYYDLARKAPACFAREVVC